MPSLTDDVLEPRSLAESLAIELDGRETHAVRESRHRSGEWLDGLAYAPLADEWSGG